jgi:hypothetical protein
MRLNESSAKLRMIRKEKVLAAAGIALIRWQVSALSDEVAIRLAFAK